MQTANCRPCCYLSWSSHHRLPKTQDSCKCTLTIFLRTPSDRTNSYDCERLNKRWSVASDIQTPRSVIYQTGEGVFLCGIQTTRRNISNTIRSVSFDIQTREGVFYLISNTEKQYIKHERKCFIWYPNTSPRSDISNTRRSVLSDIQTSRSNISDTKGSVSFDIQTPRSNISNTRSVLSDIQTLKSNISNTRSVLSDIQTLRSNISNTKGIVSFDVQTPKSNISNTKRSVSPDIQTSRRNTVVPRFNEVPGDWGNLFVISKVRLRNFRKN